MAKWDKMVTLAKEGKYKDLQAVEDTIADFTSIYNALTEAVSHYSNKELLMDYSAPWYKNARDYYEHRLDTCADLLRHLEALRASMQTKDGNNEVQGLQPSAGV